MSNCFRLILCISFIVFLSQTINAQCADPTTLYDALMSFYEQTDGENWIDNSGWKEGAEGTSCDPCADNWYGIRCVGSWVDIRLDNNNLVGEMGEEIFNLESLRELELQNNNLFGQIPEDISGSFELNLSYNQLTGTIPQHIFNNNFRYVDLSFNDLSGVIPEGLHLSSFQVLNLSNNNLTGEIPFNIPVVGANLIDFSNNNLSGTIPPTFNEITYLDLSHNNLSGTIPSEIFLNGSHVEYLDLSHNALNGEIPETIKDILWLEILDLSYNQLEGTLDDLILSDGFQFELLDVSYNRISGNVPDFPEGNGLTNLYTINLKNNNFEGCIPLTLLDRYCGTNKLFIGENSKLPFKGNLSIICSFPGGTYEQQIGAPCDVDGDSNTEESIQLDCHCGFSFSSGYESDTLYMSQDGLTHQVIVHKIFDSNNVNFINGVNLYENENNLFITGRSGVYKRSGDEIILDQLNPGNWVSFYLFPSTTWSSSDEYARLLVKQGQAFGHGDGLIYDIREFSSGSSTQIEGREDVTEFLLDHNTYKTFQSGPREGTYYLEDTYNFQTGYVVMSDGKRSINSHCQGYSVFSATSWNRYSVDGFTYIEHPFNDFEQTIQEFDFDPIDLSTVERPQFVVDACFVGENAVLVGLATDSVLQVYNPSLDSLETVPWLNESWPIRVDALNDNPIFLLENNGLQLGYDDDGPLDLKFIMNLFEFLGFASSLQDIYVDKDNHIWLHHQDTKTYSPLVEIKLDTTLGLTSQFNFPLVTNHEVNIFPNPAFESINITFANEENDRDVGYKILNLYGQSMQSGILNEARIDIANLKTGVYYLELTKGETRWIEKFIVTD